MIRCVAEAGFVMESDGVTGFLVDPGDQADEFDAAYSTCEVRVAVTAPLPPKLDRETAYDALLETARCLEAQGFEIPEAPSLEAFLDSWERGPWHPYNYVHVGAERWVELNRECPQP